MRNRGSVFCPRRLIPSLRCLRIVWSKTIKIPSGKLPTHLPAGDCPDWTASDSFHRHEHFGRSENGAGRRLSATSARTAIPDRAHGRLQRPLRLMPDRPLCGSWSPAALHHRIPRLMPKGGDIPCPGIRSAGRVVRPFPGYPHTGGSSSAGRPNHREALHPGPDSSGARSRRLDRAL